MRHEHYDDRVEFLVEKTKSLDAKYGEAAEHEIEIGSSRIASGRRDMENCGCGVFLLTAKGDSNEDKPSVS